jgi:hypothetical protein
VPRVINLLCDRALMLGAELRATVLTPAMIDQAADRLELKKPDLLPQSRFGRLLKRLRLRK